MSDAFTPILERVHMGGPQQVYRFDNGLGASVVSHSFSYGGDAGLWELGVVRFNGDTWGLTYDTPITDDVIGHLTWEDVQRILGEIAALPAEVTA